MDTVLDLLSRSVEEHLGLANGRSHFRLLQVPAVITVLGTRAGLRDAREPSRQIRGPVTRVTHRPLKGPAALARGPAAESPPDAETCENQAVKLRDRQRPPVDHGRERP